MIKTDVVESAIPLLLSQTAMKKAAIKMDLENDTATIMGKEVALNLTMSGHYCIPIDKSEESPGWECVCAVKLDALNWQDRFKTLLKLHIQFVLPRKNRLTALLKDAGVWREYFEETLAQTDEKCELCKIYSKTPSRPVVGMPMASKFNEKVAMDLKQWNGRWILHIIDMWSRYTLSVFVDRKKPGNIRNGYSSHQLVFGENPNLPNIMSNTLPALEGTTSSEVFVQHLNALHGAHKAFIQAEAEADERIRRNKVRASEQVFENGDRVFYKREGKERWLEPGKVMFQDGKVVFVRHGAVFVRVSPNRLQKVTSYLPDDRDRKSEHSLEDRDDEKQDEKDEPEPHTVSEELPAASPDKEDTQNIQQNRKKRRKQMTISNISCKTLRNE